MIVDQRALRSIKSGICALTVTLADVLPVQLLIPGSIKSSYNVPDLRSKQGNYVKPESTGWLQSALLDTPLEEMQAQYNRNGYNWIKNLMSRQDVLEMREQ